MLYYLDTVIVIYAVEGNAADKKRAKDHLEMLEQAGHRFAISEFTRTECLVPVFGPGNDQRLSDFFQFFHEPNLRTLNLMPRCMSGQVLSGAATCTRQYRRLSPNDMGWPTLSTSPPRSNPAATCF